MDMLKFSFLVLVMSECFDGNKAIGLCDFAEKFPCKDNEADVCFKHSGCKKQTSGKSRTSIQPTTMQLISYDLVNTDNVIVADRSTTNEVMDGDATTDQVNTGYATTDQVPITTPLCPPNMMSANCTTCQSSCMDPKGCTTNCTKPTPCVCPSGFLLKGDDCVQEDECECFVAGKFVIPEGGFYVNVDCTKRGACTNSQLIWNDTYMCSSDEVCDERNDVRQCYRNGIDCLDVYNDGFTDNGIYTISPKNWPGSPFKVYCNMNDGGGWTVFQRRVNGSTDFYRDWKEYKEGFGVLEHEFWLGNEKLYYLAKQATYEYRIDFVPSRSSSLYYNKHTSFRIDDETKMYRVAELGTRTGTGGYSLSYTLNKGFSTYDQDSDGQRYNCAKGHRSGWWHGGYFNIHSGNCAYFKDGSTIVSCSYANPNGDYNGGNGENHFADSVGCTIKYTEMKIRRVQ